MPMVNMHEAKTQLSRLVDAALAGEEVVIARSGAPVARLVPWVAAAPPERRQLGTLQGTITAEELAELLAPLPDDVIAAFERSAGDSEPLQPPHAQLGVQKAP